MRRLTFVLLAGALSLAPAPARAQSGDHLACYRVQDPARKTRFSVKVTNAGVTQTCTVRVPARLGCLSTAASDFVPSPPGAGPAAGTAANMLCYKMKCPRPFPANAHMTDALAGDRVVGFRGGQLFCTPAVRGPESFGSTTTTTLAAGPCRFEDNDRRCEGTCGNGGRCSAVASGGACECRTTACGDADSPECNGFCDRGEACIFSFTDCSCVSIP